MGRAGARQCLVRSKCRSRGIRHRIDAAVQALRFGASASPVDRLDRCAVVGCQGAAFYMVVRTYGRQWIVMVSGDDPRVSIAPAASAVSLDLLDPTISKAVIYIWPVCAARRQVAHDCMLKRSRLRSDIISFVYRLDSVFHYLAAREIRPKSAEYRPLARER